MREPLLGMTKETRNVAKIGDIPADVQIVIGALVQHWEVHIDEG